MPTLIDPELEAFLRYAYSWNSPHDQLLKSVTIISPDFRKAPDPKTGKHPNITANYGVRSWDQMVAKILKHRGMRRERQTNVYVALATFEKQRDDKPVYQDGTIPMHRSDWNVVSLKSLFIDVDVGADKPYKTTAEASDALMAFLVASKLPHPTFLVYSGSGGFHVYWIFKQPVLKADWQPMANALKTCAKALKFEIDPDCTADAARILRVPTTLNFKNPKSPALVEARQIGAGTMYDPTDLMPALQPYTTAQPVTPGSQATPLSPTGQNFAAGVDDRVNPNVSIDDIAAHCPMTAATLVDGGAGKSEPQWKQDMYLAAWTNNPSDAAHRLSRGYAGYDAAATDTKLKERIDSITAPGSQLGWPKCSSFTHPACATCVHNAKGQGPISFARRQALTKYQAQPIADPLSLMPDGYYRDANYHVFAKPDKDNDARELFPYAIMDAALDAVGNTLLLQIQNNGVLRWYNIPFSKLTPQGFVDSLYLGSNNTLMLRGDPKAIRACAMAWVTHLQHIGRYKHETRFGWNGDNFIIADEEFTPTGINAAYRSTLGDAVIGEYQRKGSLAPWQHAMQLVYGNTPLEVLVATAFAAPLVPLISDNSLFISICSPTGCGKSTVMRIAQAVWANPKRAIAQVADTTNAFAEKLNMINNLPAYWDDVQTDEQYNRMAELVFIILTGRLKARLSRDAKLKHVTESSTMCVVASNRGVLDDVVHQTQGSEAGQVRVFEYQTQKLPISNPRSSTMVLELNENYGEAGAIYAQWLVANKKDVKQILTAVDDQILAACQFEDKDRFRRYTLVTLIAGALLANRCGLTNFNVPAIQAFLIQTVTDLRSDTSLESYTMATPDAAENIIAQMMGELRNISMIQTNIIPPVQVGNPGMQQQKVVMAVDVEPHRMKDVWMQVGDDGRIRVRTLAFNDWLRKHKYNPKQVLKLLEKDYRRVTTKLSIGAGIHWLESAKNRSQCHDFTPYVAPAPINRSPSYPGANFGSRVP